MKGAAEYRAERAIKWLKDTVMIRWEHEMKLLTLHAFLLVDLHSTNMSCKMSIRRVSTQGYIGPGSQKSSLPPIRTPFSTSYS